MENVQFSYRPITLDDVPALLDWYNDAELHRTANSTPFEPYTLDKLLGYWKKKLIREHCAYYGIWVDGRIVGRVGLKKSPPCLDVVEFSIMIGVSGLRGHGLGTAISQEMVAVAFADPKAQIVRLYVRQDNGRAIRCYEKAGYRHVHSFTQNGVPTLMMQIERRDWLGSQLERTGQAG